MASAIRLLSFSCGSRHNLVKSRNSRILSRSFKNVILFIFASKTFQHSKHTKKTKVMFVAIISFFFFLSFVSFFKYRGVFELFCALSSLLKLTTEGDLQVWLKNYPGFKLKGKEKRRKKKESIQFLVLSHAG